MEQINPLLSNDYLFSILNTISDPIYITDGTGRTLWLNKSSEIICGYPKEKLIGRNVNELEKEGVFNPSASNLALTSGKTISTVQEMKNGQKYMVTGHLIRNNENEIHLVVAHSHNITEVVRTTVQLKNTETLLRNHSSEIRKHYTYTIDNDKKHSIGKSKEYKIIQELVEKIARVNTTVLITGETGSGKNVVAQQVHILGDRSDKPYVHVNCGAIPESLIESELFGYKKGAFTGANTKGKAGLVKVADKGTLFLDEIGEMPFQLQAKLLHFIEDKTFRPVGDSETYTADVRIIAATNRNIEQMIKEGKFRQDLFYRLNVLSIDIPPLRERKEDIVPLLHFYLKKYNQKHNKNRTFSNKILSQLEQHLWAGNIRELENLVESIVITAREDEVTVNDLPENFIAKIPKFNKRTSFDTEGTLNEIVEKLEKTFIEDSYSEHQSTRKAAKALGITQSALMRRIKKYAIDL